MHNDAVIFDIDGTLGTLPKPAAVLADGLKDLGIAVLSPLRDIFVAGHLTDLCGYPPAGLRPGADLVETLQSYEAITVRNLAGVFTLVPLTA